jgi:ATP-dependent Lhr-like helicase
MSDGGLQQVNHWFESLGREPFPFQLETWRHYLAGRSGLIQSPTGSGKTLAAAVGAMIEAINNSHAHRGNAPLALLWITPLRALASDTVESLKLAIEGLHLPWTVELRTSDTSASVRKRQKERLPTVLVTTPESMSLLISYPDSLQRLGTLQCVIVDEWHELMGTKRGVQAELAIARLRTMQPNLRIWGLSATIQNIDEAVSTLLGPVAATHAAIVHSPDDKAIAVRSLLPEKVERFPWAGHLGTRMTEAVADAIEKANSTLVFTNTRSQSELWFRSLLAARPQWLGKIALHHGSLDRKLRAGVEQFLREGKLLAVVCTSSLDLGVDFWPVDQVMQIGSPKGISRAMQRAGRSGHQPGAISQLVCVPTQAFELVEFSATRRAIEHRAVERREPVLLCLDVLAQHLVTVAAGGGFEESQLLDEVRSTHAFAAITDEQWRWVMDFAERGGPSLIAYPRFTRIVRTGGRWQVASDQTARMHRLGIGTITSDGTILVKYVGGKFLGTVEDSFIGKMKPGDNFVFAGRTLELVRVHEMTAQVRAARSKKGAVPRWYGGRLPMSASLADAVRFRLNQAADGEFADAEMQQVRPILELQQRWSLIPRLGQVIIESLSTRDGFHHFLFPFQGRLAHEGLAALLTYRFASRGLKPITATFNDYGLELLAPTPLVETSEQWKKVLSPERLEEDVVASLNTGELARRHFREIARIAGLLVPTRPGSPRSTRQLQASSELFYDVFREFDPGNLLLDQARREVLDRQLEFKRLRDALAQIGKEELLLVSPARVTPLAFPLWAERIQSQQLRSESATERIERLAHQLERAADAE